MLVEHISLMPTSWLFLTYAGQYVTYYGSANEEFVDASLDRNEEVLINRHPLISLPNPPSFLPFFLPPIPYPFRRLLRRLGSHYW